MRGPRILCVAGDDPGAGAGLQRDRATVEGLGGRFCGVVAVRTRQDRDGLHAAAPAPPAEVAIAIARALAGGVDAIKTGALGDAAVVAAVAQALAAAAPMPLVVDPVRQASKVAAPGAVLLDDDGWRALRDSLLPRASVATPNLREYGDGADFAACAAVLVTGGHGGGAEVVDRLLRPGRQPRLFRHPRIAGGEDVHGTGCALSSALATELGRGVELEEAVARAIEAVCRVLGGGTAGRMRGRGLAGT